jgi:hypothetical protein
MDEELDIVRRMSGAGLLIEQGEADDVNIYVLVVCDEVHVTYYERC